MKRYSTINLCFVSVLLLLMAGTVSAQSEVRLPYLNGFEDATENARWVLASGQLCEDKWYIDGATQFDGDSALYISSVGKDSLKYGKEQNVVVAYRKISLPTTAQYDITFDWRNRVVDENSGLFVAVYECSTNIIPQSVKGSITPIPIIDVSMRSMSLIQPDGKSVDYRLAGDGDWHSTSFSHSFRGKTDNYLVFIWINDKSDAAATRIGAAIDNLQISYSVPKPPRDIDVATKCDTIILSWSGTTSMYDLEYRKSGSDEWNVIPNWKSGTGTSHRYVIPDMNEGIYDFRIRSVTTAGQDTIRSVYVCDYSNLQFCPDLHCINYIDLRGEGVKCLSGRADSVFRLNEVAPADYGYRDKYSRHTVHWIEGETDPRTNNKLKTIPDGELASVRIGNWDINAESDGIEYTIPVDGSMSLLLLKYAIVLEDPDHPIKEQPYFGLELQDEQGRLIDPVCGTVRFYADSDADGWEVEEKIVDNKKKKIVWKNWSTIGFDLSSMAGNEVKVRLIAQDCTAGAHYGYAYFTLGCASGTIESMSCGASPTMELKAPDGFSYAWFLSDDIDRTDTLFTEQIYSVSSDDLREYVCDMIFLDPDKASAGCGFSVSTRVSPRLPFATYDYRHAPKGCENVIELTDRSHVRTRNEDGNEVPSGEMAESIVWTIDGVEYDDEVVTIEVPQSGADVQVKLSATIKGGCVDDTVYTLEVPSILTPTKTVDTTLCYGETFAYCDPVQIFGVTNDTTIRCELLNRYGCDSITVINVHALPESKQTVLWDTVCYGEASTLVTDTLIREEGRHVLNLANVHKCDSTVILNLEVLDSITFSLSSTPEEITPKSGTITIDCAEENYTYSLDGEMNVPLTDLRGGEYEVVVYNSHGCASEPQTVTVERECVELEIDARRVFSACADDSVLVIDYNHISGILSDYTIRYGAEAKEAGFVDSKHTFADDPVMVLVVPDVCKVDNYTAEVLVGDVVCDTLRLPIRFQIQYRSDIVRQKWNDVLAVTNETLNGGHIFSGFQWYRDGVAIPGETDSYYYVDNGAWLDTSAVYHVDLTRTEDGVVIPSCPVSAVRRADSMPLPMLAQTQAAPASRVQVRNVDDNVVVQIFDVRGVMWSEQTLTEHSVEMPAERGVYVVVIMTADGRYTEKVMIR